MQNEITNPNGRKRLSEVASYGFYVIFLIFIVIYIKGLDFKMLKEIRPLYIYVIPSTVIGLAVRFYNSFVWLKILNFLGANIDKYKQLNYVYAKSWLGRYIPGKVTWILGKIYFAAQYGISKKKLAVSSFFEGILQVLVAFIISSVLLFFSDALDIINHNTKIFLVLFSLSLSITLIPAVFNKIVSLLYKIIRKRDFGADNLIDGKLIIKSCLLFTVGMMANGLSYFLLNRSAYNLSWSDMFYYIGAINIASAVGIAAIIAPSGIGVREGIQILLLSHIMPKEIAILMSVVFRVWSLLLDIIYFFLSYLLGRNIPDKTRAL